MVVILVGNAIEAIMTSQQQRLNLLRQIPDNGWDHATLSAIARETAKDIRSCFADSNPPGVFDEQQLETVVQIWRKEEDDVAASIPGAFLSNGIINMSLELERLRAYVTRGARYHFHEITLTTNRNDPYAVHYRTMFLHKTVEIQRLLGTLFEKYEPPIKEMPSPVVLFGNMFALILYSADTFIYQTGLFIDSLVDLLLIYRKDERGNGKYIYLSVESADFPRAKDLLLAANEAPLKDFRRDRAIQYRAQIRGALHGFTKDLLAKPRSITRNNAMLLNNCFRAFGFFPHLTLDFSRDGSVARPFKDSLSEEITPSQNASMHIGLVIFLQVVYAFSPTLIRKQWIGFIRTAGPTTIVGHYRDHGFLPQDENNPHQRPRHFDRSVWIDSIEALLDEAQAGRSDLYLSLVGNVSDRIVSQEEYHRSTATFLHGFKIDYQKLFTQAGSHRVPMSVLSSMAQMQIIQGLDKFSPQEYQITFDDQWNLEQGLAPLGVTYAEQFKRIPQYLRDDGNSYCSALTAAFRYASPNIFLHVLLAYRERASCLPYGMLHDLANATFEMARFVFVTHGTSADDYQSYLAKVHIFHYVFDARRPVYWPATRSLKTLLGFFVNVSTIYASKPADFRWPGRVQKLFGILYLFHDLNCVPASIREEVLSMKKGSVKMIETWHPLSIMFTPYFANGKRILPILQTETYLSGRHSISIHAGRQIHAIIKELTESAESPEEKRLSEILYLMYCIVRLRTLPIGNAQQIMEQISLPSLAASRSLMGLAPTSTI